MANPHPKKVKGSKGTEPIHEQRAIRRVIAYVRISRDRETQTSIETQELAIRELCKARGWEIVIVLGDPGKSAYKKGVLRPKYKESIRMIERRQADAIVCFRLDRFSRSASEFWDAWQAIKKAGGHFLTCETGGMQFDTTNPFAEAMLFMMATVAEMESNARSERAIPMHAKQQRDGLAPGGPRPYGYDRVTSKENDGHGAILTINERESELLQMAATHILAGGSVRGFIHQYQPTSSQAQKAMTHRGLTRCLQSPTIAGGRMYGEQFIEGDWDPILDRETWDRIREFLNTDDRKRPGFRPDIGYLLTAGVMVCSKCEKSITIRNWVDKRTREVSKRYVCRNCGPSINQEIADRIATEKMFDLVPESKWQAWTNEGMGWDPAIIEEIEQRKQTFYRLYREGRMSEIDFLFNIDELEAEHDAALTGEPLDIPNVANLREAWSDLSLEDQRRVFNQAIDRIELLPLSFGRDPHARILVKGK